MSDFDLNILIIEDELALAIDLEMLIVEMGHQVIAIVDNSNDAFKEIKNQKPDLILMDIQIKGNMTGIQIAETIKKDEIPVLFITSLTDNFHFEQAQKTNPIGYLNKPIYKFTLRTILEAAFKK